jgi:nucleotide-binding universal stress UspA family protein
MLPTGADVSDSMSEPNKAAAAEAVLVALDFSSGSRRALEQTLSWCARSEITALHVVDSEFAQRAEAAGVATAADVVARLRVRAEEEFRWLQQEKGAEAFVPMIVEGIPFVEIVKVANDLQVDLIAIGTTRAATRVDQLLFGSTAEKVLRASRCPVLCVP